MNWIEQFNLGHCDDMDCSIFSFICLRFVKKIKMRNE